MSGPLSPAMQSLLAYVSALEERCATAERKRDELALEQAWLADQLEGLRALVTRLVNDALSAAIRVRQLEEWAVRTGTILPDPVDGKKSSEAS